MATANDLVPANPCPGKDNACYSFQPRLANQSSNFETPEITFQSFRLSFVFAKGLLPPGLYTSGEVIFAVYTGGAALAHMRSPGLSRRWADNALSVAVEAAYRATIDRLFHPARRIKSVSAPPSLNQHGRRNASIDGGVCHQYRPVGPGVERFAVSPMVSFVLYIPATRG